MNLSKRGEYALRVLLDLAMAKSLGRSLVPLTALAEAQSIPPAFLEQILLSLRQGGFLSSTRGKHGGYSLARAASDIPLAEILRYLEGPVLSNRCVNAGSGTPCHCPDPDHCGLRLLMGEVHGALSGVLDRYTLEGLAAVTLSRFQKDGLLPAVCEPPRPVAKGGAAKKAEDEPEYLI
ncbi:MAG: hypothetical protein RLZZ399_2346 [Verrucomicrobiota bacterium]